MASCLSSGLLGRRDRQKLDRERRIIRAARKLFAQRGYPATSMEDVAARAGLAVGTIYNYFASKPEFLLAIVRRETESLLERNRRFMQAPPTDPVDAIAGIVLLYFDDFLRDDRDLWRELFAAAIVAPATVGRRVFEADASVVAQLAEFLGRLKRNSLIRADVETQVAATAIYAVCFTWLIAYCRTTRSIPHRHGCRSAAASPSSSADCVLSAWHQQGGNMISNQWYPIYRSRRLKRGRVVGVRRLGRELVLWRDADCRAIAMDDRCPHRAARSA